MKEIIDNYFQIKAFGCIFKAFVFAFKAFEYKNKGYVLK